MNNVDGRLTKLEGMVQEIQNKIESIEPKWASLREKWTVMTGVSVLVACFIIIIVAAIFGQFIMVDKISTTFNAFIMAVLGYLFGYLPTKSSEESIRRDKEITDEKLGIMESVRDGYEKQIESMNKTINMLKELNLATQD